MINEIIVLATIVGKNYIKYEIVKTVYKWLF